MNDRQEPHDIEQWAALFHVPKPSNELKQRILHQATVQATENRSGSLTPYLASLAATLLFILCVNAAGNHVVKSRQTNYTITIHSHLTNSPQDIQAEAWQFDSPITLCICEPSQSRTSSYWIELKTLLSQGVSL